jgi:hypothetical protein
MEQYTWLIILAAWSLLLALGLAGGDPLALGQPGREAPAVKLAKWVRRTAAASWPSAPVTRLPRRAAPARHSESGLHAAV